jgi:hypothetical protein
LGKDAIVPENTSTYETNIFLEISRQVITMRCSLLGYDHEKTVDEAILGFMSSIFPPTLKPRVKLNYAQYLDDIIHFQLTKFEANKYLDLSPISYICFCIFKPSNFNTFSRRQKMKGVIPA